MSFTSCEIVEKAYIIGFMLRDWIYVENMLRIELILLLESGDFIADILYLQDITYLVIFLKCGMILTVPSILAWVHEVVY